MFRSEGNRRGGNKAEPGGLGGQVNATWQVHAQGDACHPAYSVGGRT